MQAVAIFVPIVCSLGLFTMIAIISISSANARKEKARIQADVQNRLIDKFGSAPEFIAFLSSPAGREFMGAFESQPRLNARDRILRGIRTATVLSFLGLAFTLLSIFHERDMIVPGLILLGLGVGYVISSILMMRLSKAWGLLDEKHGVSDPPALNS